MRFAVWGVVVAAVGLSLLLGKVVTRWQRDGRDRAALRLSWVGGVTLTALVVTADAVLLRRSGSETVIGVGCMVGGGVLGYLYGRLRHGGGA